MDFSPLSPLTAANVALPARTARTRWDIPELSVYPAHSRLSWMQGNWFCWVTGREEAASCLPALPDGLQALKVPQEKPWEMCDLEFRTGILSETQKRGRFLKQQPRAVSWDGDPPTSDR